METLSAYIPNDRRHALAHGVDLPERTLGAALFADISGFTPLTEALVRALGPQRGAEELPRQLNLIYDALIADVNRYGGSVIGFSGDAITCWFDTSLPSPQPSARLLPLDRRFPSLSRGGNRLSKGSTQRAVACALAMQQTMQQFASVSIPGAGSVALAIKVAVAAGPVRRFVVGDPDIQVIDVLAGETLNRLAAAERQAGKGEVALDEPAVAALGAQLRVVEWRAGEDGARFAVVGELASAVEPAPWPALEPAALSEAQMRSWLLPAVYERLRSGQGEFLTELRPAVALFLRFDGIDYDGDEQAQHKLAALIGRVQRILASYDGSLIQLTVGDKGSYLYAAFGAPLAHEDDAVRAISAALELRRLQLELAANVQIGISQGRMRTGAYGGVTRRTYGVLGDEVNMAARLMQHAPAGAVLVSLAARKSTGGAFAWDALPPLLVKGKSQPLTVFQLLGEQKQQAIRLHEPRYAQPMIGRRAELALIAHKLDQALRGRGQIVGIAAEAGMGKSRLIAEVIRLAQRRHVAGYGGECQSYGTNTSYLVWQTIWRDFFGLGQVQGPHGQLRALERSLAQISPALLPRLPLLGVALNLAIPNSDLTRTFDAKIRKASLEALLADCLRARAAESPLLLVLEDCHWIDPLSHDLLEVIGHTVAELPVLMVLAYRPPQVQRIAGPRVSRLAHFSELQLATLAPEDIEELAHSKIKQLYGGQTVVSSDLIAQLAARTEGNPFYIEELLNYLHDQDINPQQPQALRQVDLPASLHSLILSRIDRLSEDQRTLVKVASVIGRLFQAAMLWGVSNLFGAQEQLRRELAALSEQELTVEDTPEPELAYLFKHIITQEVAYESLPYAIRTSLHEQIGQYIERTFPDATGRYVDLLAFHYDRSRNEGKRHEYLLKAGDAARAGYANAAAVDYYRRLLPLLPAEEQCAVLTRLAQVLEIEGHWDEAHARYREALALAERLGDRGMKAQTQALIGELLRKQGQYTQALPWLEQARAAWEALGERSGLAQVLHFTGSLAMHQGNYNGARGFYEASLAIRREQNDLQAIASLLSNLSIVAYHQGDVERAWELCRDGLALRREIGNKLWIANSLGNLGMLALEAGNHTEAHAFMDEALTLEREVGDRSAIAISLNNLGSVAREQGNYVQAHVLYRESLAITRDLGDSWALCYLLEDIACLTALRGYADPALRLAAAAAALRTQINAPLSPPEQASLDRKLEPVHQALGPAAPAIWDAGGALGRDDAIRFALAIASEKPGRLGGAAGPSE
jgi:predicted ATPase/class 3 adenylate cyclase